MPSIISALGNGGGGGVNQTYLNAQAKLDEAEEKPKKKGGFFDGLKNVGAKALGVLDTGRAALVSTGMELGDLAGDIIGKDTGSDASLKDWLSQTKRRVGAGEVVEDSGLFGDNIWAKRAVGGVLDIAADPLNALGGVSSLSKEGLAKVGMEIGDDAARQALRSGGERGLREALEATGKSLEDVLATGTGSFGRTLPQDRIAKQIGEMGRDAGGGIGVRALGHRAALGGKQLDRLGDAWKGSQFGQQTRALFTPTARVADKLGKGAASATDNALHSAAQARREASLTGAQDIKAGLDEAGKETLNALPRGERLRFFEEAADDIATKKAQEKANKLAAKAGVDPTDVAPVKGAWRDEIQAAQNKAIAEDLLDAAPNFITTNAQEAAQKGWADLGNGFHAPQEIVDVIHASVSAAPSDIVKWIDTGTNALKRWTTLGPLNAIPHVSRNIASNMLFAGMFGGVKTMKPWSEVRQYRKILQDVVKEADEARLLKAPHPGVNVRTLMAKGLDEQSAKRAMLLHEEGLAGRGGHLFDDVANDLDDAGATGKKGHFGTKNAEAINTWHEELSRGAVFLQGLDDGLSPQMAAQKSRKAMLDYSQEGLSKFERDKLARLVFFYKFPRRAIPAGMKFTIEHPGYAMTSSRLGAGVDLGDRNSYGEAIGLSFDTPLESAFGSVNEMLTSPGKFAADSLHPAFVAAGDKDKRGLRDLLPPLDQAFNRGEALLSDAPLMAPPLSQTGTENGKLVGPGGGLLGPSLIPGARVGKDYDAVENQTAKDEFTGDEVAQYQQTPKDRLVLAAERAGVENPYTLTEKDLLAALVKKGVKRDVLLTLLTA